MNIESLNLEDFDINTHVPPSFKDKFVSIYEQDYNDDNYRENLSHEFTDSDGSGSDYSDTGDTGDTGDAGDAGNAGDAGASCDEFKRRNLSESGSEHNSDTASDEIAINLNQNNQNHTHDLKHYSENTYNSIDDINLDETDNIIYSFPFYSKDGIDFEYRITIKDDELILEQVRCDDSEIDFGDCVEVLEEIYRGELAESVELIQKNIDLRDNTSVLVEGIIDYDFDLIQNDKVKLNDKIKQNKISVLYELYKEITDVVYR